MNLTQNFNCSDGGSEPETPGTFNVRVKYLALQDSGHVSGPFTRSEASKAAVAALSRSDVQSVTIEEIV